MENLTGVKELMALLEKVEKVPAKALTPAVKKAAVTARNDARTLSPKLTGNLRKSIGIWAEKRRTGKKVYQLAFSKNFNETFVKVSATGKRSYYPASQEYGFRARNGRKIAGKFFIKRASKDKKQELQQMMVDELANSLRSLGGAK